MKKFFLVVFILLDLAVIAVSVLFLIAHLQAPAGSFSTPTSVSRPMMAGTRPSPIAPATPVPLKPTVPGAPGMATSTTSPAPGTPPAAAPNQHKILFAYRNSKSKKVMIRADFTGWRAEPMQKDANSIWRYTALLEPGEYAYCFSVDNKSIRDPANKRTKQVGKTFVSAIVVKAPPAAPH